MMHPGGFIFQYGVLILVLACTFVEIVWLLAGGDPLWPLVILLPLSGLGIWDLLQSRHTLMRNHPITARMRWFFEWLRPYLRQYIVEGDLMGRPINREQRSLVYERAKGVVDVQPYGTDLDAYSSKYEWISHSIIPEPKSKEQFRVTVGGPDCTKPYSASVLNISAMSFGALGARAIESLNLGAKLGGFYHDTGEGGFSKHHRSHGGDIVWEIGTGYFGCRDRQGKFDFDLFADQAQLDQVRMIEIKLSQGAKPGGGGILPGPKVTPEIAEARGVPAWQECISPAAHSAFSTPLELLEFTSRLRERSGGKPVGIKLCIGHPTEFLAICKAMLESNMLIDFVVVDGTEGGTGAAPKELSDHVGYPLREGLIFVQNALVGTGLRPKIKLAASAKIVSAFEMAANLAIGADWCNSARAFMFALGCVMSKRCHTDLCPTGVTTHDPARQRGLVVEEKAQRVRQFQQKTVEALIELVSVAGLRHPNELRPRHLYHRVSPKEVRTVDQIYEFLKPGSLIEAPEQTPYAEAWTAADANSFRAAASLGPERYD